MKYASVLVFSAMPLIASAQDIIKGEVYPCFEATQVYQYCRIENFPYIWSWSASGDAKVTELSPSGGCYKAEVKFGMTRNIVLTFHQKNPPSVPAVYDVAKNIFPKKCTANLEGDV